MNTTKSKNTGTPDALFLQIVEVLKSPQFSVDSSFRTLTQQQPYRELVALGQSAISFCIGRLREGAIFLVPAVLEIWNVRAEDLGLQQYASDNEVAARLVQAWEDLNAIHWNPSAAYPTLAPTVELVATEPSATIIDLLRFGGLMPSRDRLEQA